MPSAPTNASSTPLPRAADAVERAHEWVERQASSTPGFGGAHLKGSLLTAPAHAPWQAHRDVDVNIVLEDAPKSHRFTDAIYEGLLIDCTWIDATFYASAESVLTNIALAPNLALPGVILADPTGRLGALAEQVAALYGEERWVRARCLRCRETAAASLTVLEEAPLFDAATALWKLVERIGAQLAMAHLRAPTHRRCLVMIGELLQESRHGELHEAVLELAGFSTVTAEQALQLVDECEALFDRARARLDEGSDLPPGSRFRPQARSYVLTGSRSMIDAGHPREAMHWIVAQLSLVLGALLHLETGARRAEHRARLLEVVAGQGLATEEARRRRAALAASICRRVDDLVDHLLQTNFGKGAR